MNPNNIIFSDHKIFFIDFENAAQDDPFYDLGTIGIFYIFDSYHEQLFLNSYFDRIPTQEEYAYYQQMKQMALLFVASNLLNFVPREMIQHSSCMTESFEKMLHGVSNGTVNIADPADQLKLAVSMLQEVLKFHS